MKKSQQSLFLRDNAKKEPPVRAALSIELFSQMIMNRGMISADGSSDL